MTTDNYYFLTIKNFHKVASAFAPKGIKLDHELISDLEGLNEMPFELNLVKLAVEKNGLTQNNDLTNLESIWLDYQPNSLAWPLMSVRFKELITENLKGKESINWIKVIINGNSESRFYYILRFEKKLDVLDINQTLFAKGTDHIVRPHFSLEKIKEFSIFNKPASHNLWKITSGLYINEKLRKAIIREKLTGPAFERVRVS
jgi:hypothetical protein